MPPSSPAGSGAPGHVASRAPEAVARGGLSAAQVRAGVIAHTRGLRACFENEADAQPELHGTVNMAWQISADGRVQDARVTSTTVGSPAVEACLLEEVRSWEFPSAEGPTTIAGWPFRFLPHGR